MVNIIFCYITPYFLRKNYEICHFFDNIPWFWRGWWVFLMGHQIYPSKSDFLNFKKPKIAHNSLNNGVRAVFTPFLDFQFFWTFYQKIRFLGEKIKIFSKERHESIANLIQKLKRTAISLWWIWFCVKINLDWWYFSKKP